MELDINALSRPYDPSVDDEEQGMPVPGFAQGGEAGSGGYYKTIDDSQNGGSVYQVWVPDPTMGGGSAPPATSGSPAVDNPKTYLLGQPVDVAGYTDPTTEEGRVAALRAYLNKAPSDALQRLSSIPNLGQGNTVIPTLPIDPATGAPKDYRSYITTYTPDPEPVDPLNPNDLKPPPPAPQQRFDAQRMLDDYNKAVNYIPVKTPRDAAGPKMPSQQDLQNRLKTGLPAMGLFTDVSKYDPRNNPNFYPFLTNPYAPVTVPTPEVTRAPRTIVPYKPPSGDSGGTVDLAVTVYGPDGKMYGSPAEARAAGVTNYTMERPGAGVMGGAGAGVMGRYANGGMVQHFAGGGGVNENALNWQDNYTSEAEKRYQQGVDVFNNATAAFNNSLKNPALASLSNQEQANYVSMQQEKMQAEIVKAQILQGILPDPNRSTGGTTSPVTTSPVTTSPVTTSPVTTSPVTTSPVTTSPVTRPPVTTTPVTTTPVTTPPVTGGGGVDITVPDLPGYVYQPAPVDVTPITEVPTAPGTNIPYVPIPVPQVQKIPGTYIPYSSLDSILGRNNPYSGFAGTSSGTTPADVGTSGVPMAPGTNIPYQPLPGGTVNTAPGTNIPYQPLPGFLNQAAPKADIKPFNAAYNNNQNLNSVMGQLPQGFTYNPNDYFGTTKAQTDIANNSNLTPTALGTTGSYVDRLGNTIAIPMINPITTFVKRAAGGLVGDEEDDDKESSGAKQMMKGYEQLTGPRQTQVVSSPNRQAVRTQQASQIVDKQGRPAGMAMNYSSMSAAQGSASPEQMATAKAMLANLMRQNLTKRRFADGGDVSNFTGGASDKKGAPDDKLTFGDKYLVEPALDLYAKFTDRGSLPSNKRIFLDSVRGGDRSQITEKNFSPSELAQMDEVVRGRYKGLSEPLTKYGQHLEEVLKGKLSKEEKTQYMTDLDMIKKFQSGQFTPALMALAEGEEPSNARRRGLVMSGAAGDLAKLGKILPEVTYSDYPTGVVQKSRSLSAGKTPAESNATSLGQFKYGLGPDGNFVIKDDYDFNQRVGSEGLDAVPSVVTEGLYGRLREYAGRKMPPGQGRDVLVNLPKRADGSPEEGEGYVAPPNPFGRQAANQARQRAEIAERSRIAAAREKVANTPALDEAGGETTDEFIQRTMGFDPSVNEKRGTFLPMPIKRNGKTEFIAPNILKDALLPYNLSSQALTTGRFDEEKVPEAAMNTSLASLATGKAPAGSLGMAVRPTGSTLLTGPVGLNRKVGNIDKILDDGVTNAFVVAGNDDQQKTLIQDFWNKKARNYFTRQFGTPDDPIATGIAKKRIKGSALEKDFPDYMIDQLGVGKTRVNEQGQTRFFPKYPRAEEDFTKRYDKATGLEGIVLLNNSAASEPGYNYLSRIGRGLTQDAETKEIDRILNQNVRPELINTSIRGAAPSNTQPGTYIGGSTAEELFKAYEEAAAYNRMTPEQQRAWANEEYGNGRNVGGMSLTEVGENLMPQNMRTAVEKGEPIYQAGNMEKPLRELFNPASINQYLTTLPLRELANIRFEDAVRGGLKVRDDVLRLENLAEKIKAGKPVPDSVFSEGVSAPLLQFAEGPLEGFSWKRIEKRQATVPEGAYVGHSVGGYETGGIGYGRDKMEGFNEGRWQVFTLRDARNRPVNTVEVRMDAGGPTVTQIKGNGRATGNTAPEKYDTAVLSFLQDYLKPTKISEDLLTPILQSYKRNLETNVEANELQNLYRELALEPPVIRLGQEAQPQLGAPNAREQLQLQQDLQEAARARIRARAGRQAPE